jgi:hypothetical protein
MLENINGKLLVYVSHSTSDEERLKSVSAAAERMAKVLKLNFEVITLGDEFAPIYVYYKNGEDEPIPVYCDRGRKTNEGEMYMAVRDMMFVLSFHPRHSTLKRVRKAITRFS